MGTDFSVIWRRWVLITVHNKKEAKYEYMNRTYHLNWKKRVQLIASARKKILHIINNT